MRQLEEIRGSTRSPKSSCASTPSTGTPTSASRVSFDFSPKSLEKHCRPIGDVMVEAEIKGTLLERLVYVEDRVRKLCLQLEEDVEAEKKREEPEKRTPKKSLKQLVKSCVKGKRKNH